MKNKEIIQISNLIKRKTGKSLKLSMITFFFSLLLLSTGISIAYSQYNEWTENFELNDNTHIITISSKKNNKNFLFRDKEIIKKNVEKGKVTVEYALENGIYNEKYGEVYIHSLDNNNKILLDIDRYNEKNNYSNRNVGKTLSLDIPIIDIEKGGFSSSNTIKKKYGNLVKIGKNPIVYLFEKKGDLELFLSFSEFKKIINIAFGTKWDDFKQKYDNKNPFKMNIIKKYYVYIDDIKDIEHSAEMLERKGYNVVYTIKAFNSIDKSIRLTGLLIMLFLTTLSSISFLVMYTSSKSHLLNQKKDIGIMKQMGFSKTTLSRIYCKVFEKTFAIPVFIIMVYALISCMIITKSIYIIFINILIVVMIYKILMICIRKKIEKIVDISVLELINDKEFE